MVGMKVKETRTYTSDVCPQEALSAETSPIVTKFKIVLFFLMQPKNNPTT